MQTLPREIFYESIYELPYFDVVDQFVRSAVAPYPIDSTFWHWVVEKKLRKLTVKEYFHDAVLNGELRVVEILVAEHDAQKYLTGKLMQALLRHCDYSTYSKTYFNLFLFLAQYCDLKGLIAKIRRVIFRSLFERITYPSNNYRLKLSGQEISSAESTVIVAGLTRQLVQQILNEELREALLLALEEPVNEEESESESVSETSESKRKPKLSNVIRGNNLVRLHPKVACFFQQYFLIYVGDNKRALEMSDLLDFYLCCEDTTFSFEFRVEGDDEEYFWSNELTSYSNAFAKNIFTVALAHQDDTLLRKVLRLKDDVRIRTNTHIGANFLELLIKKLPLKALDVAWAYRNDEEMFDIYSIRSKTELKAEKLIARKKSERKYKKLARPQGQVVISGPLYEHLRLVLRRGVSAEQFADVIRLASDGKYLLIFSTTAGSDSAFFLNAKALQSMQNVIQLTDEDVVVADYMKDFVADPIVSFSLVKYP